MPVSRPSDITSVPRPALPLARYRVRFRECVPESAAAAVSALGRGFLGSAWRGALGHALRRTVCVTRLPACDPCMLLRSCPYPFLFESRTPPGAEKLTRYPRTPGPYVLEPADQRFDTHDGTVNLGVTLFGPANAHLPYLAHALDQAGRNGLTARRVVLKLHDVQAETRCDDAGNQAALGAGTGAGLGAGLGAGMGAGDELGENGSGSGGDGDRYGENEGGDAGGGAGHGESSGSHGGIGAEHDGWRTIFEPGGRLSPVAAEHRAPPAPPPAVRVRLLAPLRVKRHEHFVGASDFDFRAFAGGLLRRISLLTYFFGETPLETDFAALLRRAESIPVTGCDLHWRELTRHSSRQRAKLQMGGLVGRFELDGAELLPFWPLLWLGQWTHAGKGCSMGLGRYVLEPLDGDGAISPPDGASWPAPIRL